MVHLRGVGENVGNGKTCKHGARPKVIARKVTNNFFPRQNHICPLTSPFSTQKQLEKGWTVFRDFLLSIGAVNLLSSG
jgi:hypothetical protein